MTAGIETRDAGGVPLAEPRAVPEHVVPDDERPSAGPAADTGPIDEAVVTGRALHAALSGVLLGTPVAVTTAVVAALSGSHLLIEDVPGVGKTVLARALATALGVELSRVQGHPDLLPSDVTGVTVFSPDNGTWEFRPGPVFGHVVLLDEMNRTPPRTQSALLEAMEEQQVSVDGESWPLPRPHLVIGTQNPIGQLGTYPLVESQLDRFGLSTSIGYPAADVETRLVLHNGGRYALDRLVPVSDADGWRRAIAATASVHVATPVAEYAVSLVRATRTAGTVRLGASPRAAISLLRSAQAYAVLSARAYTTPQDVQAVAVACLAHRLIAEGGSDGGPALVARIVADLPVPPT
jgi:MoxR-like ATPase